MERYSPRGIAARLFLTCWLVYCLHFATNIVRELYPVLSLGDGLSFDVSEYLGLHPDIFALPGRGAFINNNPGASIMGALPYALARPAIEAISAQVQGQRATAGAAPPTYDSIYPLARAFQRQAFVRGLDVKFGLAAGVVHVWLMAPLSALSVVVMFYLLFSLTHSKTKAAWLALLYAFATPIFYRTAQLNHNLLQAHFALFSLALLWQPWRNQQRPRYFLAGLLAGWTLVLDYSGLVIIVALSLYAFFKRRSLPAEARRRGDLFLFAAGVAACAVFLVAYQWRVFGHPLYPAQHYMPATEFSGYGYQGMDWPQLDLLWLNAFGIRFGLFTSAPILLLALFIPAWLGTRYRLAGKRETAFFLFLTGAFFLFTAANQFSRMQFNSGVRHMVPVVPFLFIIAAGVLLQMRRWLAVTLALLATYWSWSLAMYRDVEQGLGILESLIAISSGGPRLPWLGTLAAMGYVPAGWLAIPLLALCALAIWLLWRINFESRLVGRTDPDRGRRQDGSRDNDLDIVMRS